MVSHCVGFAMEPGVKTINQPEYYNTSNVKLESDWQRRQIDEKRGFPSLPFTSQLKPQTPQYISNVPSQTGTFSRA